MTTATAPRPIVKAVERKLTYFDARAIVLTEHHDTNRVGVRTITTEWLDDADPRNGGHKAGTVTRKTVKGDGRIATGRNAWHVLVAEHIVSA